VIIPDPEGREGARAGLGSVNPPGMGAACESELSKNIDARVVEVRGVMEIRPAVVPDRQTLGDGARGCGCPGAGTTMKARVTRESPVDLWGRLPARSCRLSVLKMNRAGPVFTPSLTTKPHPPAVEQRFSGGLALWTIHPPWGRGNVTNKVSCCHSPPHRRASNARAVVGHPPRPVVLNCMPHALKPCFLWCVRADKPSETRLFADRVQRRLTRGAHERGVVYPRRAARLCSTPPPGEPEESIHSHLLVFWAADVGPPRRHAHAGFPPPLAGKCNPFARSAACEGNTDRPDERRVHDAPPLSRVNRENTGQRRVTSARPRSMTLNRFGLRLAPGRALPAFCSESPLRALGQVADRPERDLDVSGFGRPPHDAQRPAAPNQGRVVGARENRSVRCLANRTPASTHWGV